MKCPNCQQTLTDDARFCGGCGYKMPVAGVAAPAAAASLPGAPFSAAGVTSAPEASMPGLVERAKNILLMPKTEWPVIAPEPTTPAQLYTGYVIPLAGFAAAISVIHLSLIGISMPFSGTFRLPLMSGLSSGILTFIFGLIGLYLVALIINGLAPTFAGERNQRQALKVAAYAFTPAWLSTVLSLLPTLSSLLQLIAGLYGIYLLFLGLPVLMKAPRERAVGYTATVVVCSILVGILFGVLSAVTRGITHLGNPYGSPYAASSGTSAANEVAARERGAAVAGNVLGSMLGTDAQGKAGLGKAIAQMAQAGQQIEQQNAAASGGTTAAAASGSGAAAAGAATGLAAALGGALAGSRHVEPVDFRTLKAMLPDSLPGMQRTGAEGSNNQAAGVKASSATGDYKGAADERIQVRIADVSGVSGLLAMANSLGAQTTDAESDTGYEKQKTIDGRQFHEKFQNAGKHGELGVIVAQRFSVDLTGDGVDMETLEQAAGRIDLAHLESMKDQGAQPN